MTVIVRRAHRRQYVHVHEVATKKSLLSRWAGARLKSGGTENRQQKAQAM
ncbi:MAG: hypothetical protein IKU14_05305 [Rhodocyclaceae bacterium]|nr:hypothetical protein [Rhodocyclaceae bacterium]